MTHIPYILAIDHGTSGIKAAIVSVNGEIVDHAFEKTPIAFLAGGGAEQDPEDWWRALVAAAARLVGRNPDCSKAIICVAVSSTFSTTVAVNRKGRPLLNALTWMDSRGAAEVRKLVSGFPGINGYSLATLAKWVPKTGGAPTLSGKDDIAHVLFIKNTRPAIYADTYMFLPSKDYLNLRLTGEFASSYDAMQLFWATDIRDVDRIAYDKKLIRAMGIDAEKLPPMMPATDILGTLKKDVAGQIGLSPKVRVISCSPDHQTACVGSGAVSDFSAHLYVGTSSWIQTVVPFKKTDLLHSIASFPTAIPGKYQSVNEQDLAGGCLAHLFEKLLFYENALYARDQEQDPYALLDAIAGAVAPGSDKLIYLPWLNGERTPVDDITLRGGFFNMGKTHTQDHMIRSVLEGVALNTRWSLKYVEKFAGRTLEPIHFIGGGAKSALWCQIFADVLNRRICQVSRPMQANARGAAWIAAVGLGYISFDDIPALTRIAGVYTPGNENRGLYDELFDVFVAIYKRNRKLFKRLNAA